MRTKALTKQVTASTAGHVIRQVATNAAFGTGDSDGDDDESKTYLRTVGCYR